MKKLIILLCCCFFIVGCGKPEIDFSGNTTTLQIPTETMSYLQLNMPAELFPIIATDYVNYFQLQHDVQVYRVVRTEETVSSDKNTMVIPIDDQWSCMIAWKDKQVGNAIKNAGFTREQFDSLPLEEVSYLDTRFDTANDMSDAMKMSASKVYMPEGVIQTLPGLYNTDILLDNSDFISCWIQDGLRDEITLILSSYIHSNSLETCHDVDITSRDNIIYMKDDSRVIAAIQLQRNEWCIYHSTLKYEDYILTAIRKLKSTIS